MVFTNLNLNLIGRAADLVRAVGLTGSRQSASAFTDLESQGAATRPPAQIASRSSLPPPDASGPIDLEAQCSQTRPSAQSAMPRPAPRSSFTRLSDAMRSHVFTAGNAPGSLDAAMGHDGAPINASSNSLRSGQSLMPKKAISQSGEELPWPVATKDRSPTLANKLLSD